MAKHKYSKKNVESQQSEVSLNETASSVALENNTDEKTQVITKKAKRRQKAQEVSAETSVKPENSGKKTLTSDQYRTMSPTRKPSKKPTSGNQRKGVQDKNTAGKRIGAWFRGMKAELKAVTWPPFKSSSKVTGVWSNIGTVLLVVLFFLIIVTAFDTGLTSLFKLLVGIGN